jgi:hypothetical protein
MEDLNVQSLWFEICTFERQTAAARAVPTIFNAFSAFSGGHLLAADEEPKTVEEQKNDQTSPFRRKDRFPMSRLRPPADPSRGKPSPL